MKQQTKSKALIILNIILLLALFTIPAYAYWVNKDNLKAPDQVTDSETIEIGEGQEVITVVELTKTVVGGKLVPIGKAVEATDVEEVVLTFKVLWTDEDEASHGADGTLTVTPEFNPNPANLLNVVVTGNGDGLITAGTPKAITLTITLKEPANLAEYESVAGETFKLKITFSVAEDPNE